MRGIPQLLKVLTWFHQSWRGHEECRVADAPGRGDDLATATVDGLRCDGGIQDLELDVADGLVAQRPLAHTPLEALGICGWEVLNTWRGM